MKINIVIPTFNRSAKLERLLKTYSKWEKKPIIHILDSSSGDHLKANKDLCRLYPNIEYYSYEKDCPLPVRLLDWLSKSSTPDIFFMGNDEDLFFEKYADYSFKYLSQNKQVSTLIGSTITILTPLFGIIPQISLKKTISIPFDIKGDFIEKIFTHSFLNSSTKFPPLFYGIRRKKQLIEYYKNLINFDFKNTTMELADQIYLLKAGDIRCENIYMCFRDESRINYTRETRRQGLMGYIPAEEIKLFFESLFGKGNSIYLNFYSRFYPALEIIDNKISSEDLIEMYFDSFDIKLFSINKKQRFFYNLTSRLIYKTAFLLNTIFILFLISRDFYKLFFFINVILNPLKVNKIYKNDKNKII